MGDGGGGFAGLDDVNAGLLIRDVLRTGGCCKFDFSGSGRRSDVDDDRGGRDGGGGFDASERDWFEGELSAEDTADVFSGVSVDGVALSTAS